MLRRFADFADRGGRDLTSDLFLRGGRVRTCRSAYLGRAAGDGPALCRLAEGLDPEKNEVPPKGLITSHYRRQRPYIYSDREIARIVREAAGYHPRTGSGAGPFHTVRTDRGHRAEDQRSLVDEQ